MRSLYITILSVLIFMAFAGAYWQNNSSFGVYTNKPNDQYFENPVSQNNSTKEFKVKRGEKLKVNLKSGGGLIITGWDKNLVSVKTKGIDDATDNLSISKNHDGIEISSPVSWAHGVNSHVTVYINVPDNFNLDLYTMGGPISIKNVDGKMIGKTLGGELNLDHLKGYVNLNTMGGSINLTNSELDGKVNTLGGDVLMENIKGNVKGSSMGGEVSMKNVTRSNGNSTKNEVNISSMGGAINVNKAPSGAKVSTMGGDIRIKDADKFVKAKTMGGDINLDGINGWIEATTMGGNIKAKMVGDPESGDRHVELNSMGGDITLVVPKNLSMNIAITLTYTKNKGNKYNIYSDFDLSKTNSKKWDYSNGTPRKYNKAKGITGSGKNKIIINTINGNIYLKKS